jgi:tripeptidyl-peptidase I
LAPKFKNPTSKIHLNDLSTCDQVITPQCIATLYSIPPSRKYPYPGNSLGIFEHGDNLTTASLNLFFANFTPWIPQNTYPHEIDIDIIPSTENSQEHGEAELDFQLAYPIVWPQNITSFQVDDVWYTGYGWSVGKGLFNTFLDAIDGVNAPHSSC